MLNRIKNHPFLFVEFLLLCLVVPGIIISNRWAPFMFAFLWGASLYGFLILRYYYWEGFKHLWKWDAVTWENMKVILGRWVVCCVIMVTFVLWYDPERFLYMVQHRPAFVPYLLIAYPVLSAFPQEFLFCSFFFRRYKPFFGAGVWMVIMSAIVFAYAHVLYINPVAPTLGLIAGLIFAATYLKTQSLALVTIEHGLYGNALFVIGLGWYFYSGSVVPQ